MLGTTGDAGDPTATDPVLRESSKVAAVVAYFPPVDLTAHRRPERSVPGARLRSGEGAIGVADLLRHRR